MQLTDRSAFESLLQSAARSTGIITTFEPEMAGVFSAAILFVLDDQVLLELTCGLLPRASLRVCRRGSGEPTLRHQNPKGVAAFQSLGISCFIFEA